MKNFKVILSRSTHYKVPAENELDALEKALRYRDLGWMEDVEEVGDGPYTCSVEELKT